MKILPPSLSPERVKVDDFYAARSRIIPPLPWPIFAPPFSILQRAGISAPKFGIGTSLKEIKSAVSDICYPIVLKPVDRASCRGVIKVDHEEHLPAAFLYTASFSGPDKRIVINEFISGTEHSVEGLMINGEYHCTAISDRIFKYTEYFPNFVEVGDIMPSILDAEQQKEIVELTASAAKALNINFGVVKSDIIFDKKRGAMVLEIAPRLGGPRFGTEMVPLANGTNILKATIQQAVGDEIDFSLLKPSQLGGMVNRSLFPTPGRVVEISGFERLSDIPGFYDFKWWNIRPLAVGDIISKPENNSGDIGYFITYGKDREEALKAADMVEATIKIVTEEV
ncbi:ATP-grasp domain-containing protein [Paracoccus sp. 08]|uniref:ATP-grasp domain-containing protein n=1 Tax=Paracoccus sp. 08 TaxID=2606624 RepID=UPI0020963D33